MKQYLRLCVSCVVLSALLAAIPVSSANGQSPDLKNPEVLRVINSAESHYLKGQDSYASGQYDRARREFDQAVDILLISAIDIRSDENLRIYYRSLIEKINRYQIAALEQKEGGVSMQLHEPSPLDKIASLSPTDLEESGIDDQDINEKGFNFKFTATSPVRQFVSYFTRGKGRATMEAGLMRSVRYREMARRIFKEEGVPTDLVWLAQVESGWNPHALSSAEARGIWQFIPATGARFGLNQNYWVDERSNPEKSTKAAARYLKWLSNRYHGNWELALAAYNTGERNIDSAVARSGAADFWRLHGNGSLPQETRNYVPAILAVVSIAKDPKKYGLDVPPPLSYRYTTHPIAKQTDLKAIAKRLKVSYSDLVEMNPELQHGVTPPGAHLVRIPATLESLKAKGE